jgi:hypothetical protein
VYKDNVHIKLRASFSFLFFYICLWQHLSRKRFFFLIKCTFSFIISNYIFLLLLLFFFGLFIYYLLFLYISIYILYLYIYIIKIIIFYVMCYIEKEVYYIKPPVYLGIVEVILNSFM